MRQLSKNTVALLFALFFLAPCFSQDMVYTFKADSSSLWKRTLISASEILSINMGVWAFDRYVAKSDFAYISGRTIKNNFREGFVWDNDCLGTNMLMHPYHGSLYFNAARTNGFNYYQSLPFTFGGSLMWELFLENESPSISDLICTSTAGSMFGEASFRIANLIIDNSATGVNRVFREIFAGLISPVSGLNRVISGNAWRRSSHANVDKPDFEFNISLGTRMMKPLMDGRFKGFGELAMGLEYNPEREEVEKPFDWFSVDATLDFRASAVYVRRMNVSALLWSKPLVTKPNRSLDFGIYQNLNYWDSSDKHYQTTPFRFSQTFALGPGINYNSSSKNKKTKLQFTTIINGIGLGGGLTDYYWVCDRDYSFGSGFSMQNKLSLSLFDSLIRFSFEANNYSLFTWEDYDPKRNLYNEKLKYLDAQGDKGYSNFTTVEASLGYYPKQNWNIELVADFVNRYNHYKHYPSLNYNAWSYGIRVGYSFD